MNVYDFDETIYSGDSTRDFYFYSIKKDKTLLRFLPKQGWAFLKYMFGIISKTQFKEKFYVFLSGIKNIDEEIKLFWQEKEKNIKDWYKNQKRDDDVIISASPEFLLKPMAEKYSFTLMASRVCKNSGKTDGENCYGEEKVLRFYNMFPGGHIDKFYSDSLSDTPLARLADKAYIVKEDDLVLWNEYKPGILKRLIKMFVAKDFLAFLAVGCINTLNGVLFSMLFSQIFSNINLSFTCGYLSSLVISFLLNSRFVFRERANFIKFIKFAVSYLPNFAVQSLCIVLFGNILGLHKLFVYTISAVIGVPVTFLLLKLFAFRKKD